MASRVSSSLVRALILFVVVFSTASYAFAQEEEEDTGALKTVGKTAGRAYERFREFITKEWRPQDNVAGIIEEFLDEEMDKLRSVAHNATFWQKQASWYQLRGELAKARCVALHMPAVKSTAAVARLYLSKLDAQKDSNVISIELFDDLSQVGRVSMNMTRLHDVMSQCMIDTEEREGTLSWRQEAYSLNPGRQFSMYRFVSRQPLNPSRRPFR